MSLANNHARDFGEKGRTASMQALDEVGLLHSGRVGDVARWKVKGVFIALIAYAPFGGSHDLLDIPLSEKQIKELAKTNDLVLVSMHAGADLVIGHGPHVPRAVELYKNRLIAYSLGNFLTYQGIRISGDYGIAPILIGVLSADGRFKQGQIISARQYRPQGTLLDKEHTAAKIIKELTESDFPDTPLHFQNNGLITPISPSLSNSIK